jgi:hypothetical protein
MQVVLAGGRDAVPHPGQQVDRQQVHRVHQEDPDEHGQRQRGDELAALGVVHDALGLRVDHLDEQLHRGLEAARHARRGLARGAPQEEAADHAQQDGEEDRVHVDHGEVGHRLLLVVLQVLQVMDDVLAGGRRVSCGCHLRVVLVFCRCLQRPRHRSANQ